MPISTRTTKRTTSTRNEAVTSRRSVQQAGSFVLIAMLMLATGLPADDLSPLKPANSEQAEESSEDSTYRVMTYNIKRGEGNDGKTDLERSAQVIANEKPDFVGLQEIDENARRSGNVDQADALGKRLGMNAAFGWFMPFQGGRYGMAVLSRYPIRESRSFKLPAGNEPRIALAVEVELPSGESLMLVNVHFDWVNDDSYRFAQARSLQTFLDQLTMPFILMGDFNDTPDSRTVKLLAAGRLEAKKPEQDRLTYSATNPRVEIDYLFASPASRWKVNDVRVIDEPLASDHRPVAADFQLIDR